MQVSFNNSKSAAWPKSQYFLPAGIAVQLAVVHMKQDEVWQNNPRDLDMQ